VGIEPLNPDLAKEYKSPVSNGALINEVLPETPAAKAGLKHGDVIVELNGEKVMDNDEFHLAVSELYPESKATLKVFRDGAEKTVTVTLAAIPERTLADRDAGTKGGNPLSGVTLSDLTAKLRQDYSVPQHIQGGAIVTAVEADSPAHKVGLRAGDLILSINHQPVSAAADVAELVHNAPDGRALLRVRTHDEDNKPTMRFYLLQTDNP
jgi:serine protease Do